MNEAPKKLTPLQAWEKMKTWCDWQERCHYDCENKLRSHGLTPEETASILSRLIDENLLNEERFAIQFAGGHFRLKKWGRKKIEYALKQKKVSDYCIKKAMAQIEEPQYQQNLQKLAEAKWKLAGRKTPAQRWAAVRQHLLQKGYSPAEVLKTLQALQAGTFDKND